MGENEEGTERHLFFVAGSPVFALTLGLIASSVFNVISDYVLVPFSVDRLMVARYLRDVLTRNKPNRYCENPVRSLVKELSRPHNFAYRIHNVVLCRGFVGVAVKRID